MHRLAICCLFACSICLAQPTTRPGREAGRPGPALQRIEAAVRELDVSEDQLSRIRAILEEARAQMRDLTDEMREMEPSDRQAKLREFMNSLREKIAAELNDQQKAALQEKLGGLGDPGGPARNPGAMIERLGQAVDQLDLTDSQKADIRRILSEAREKFQAAREKSRSGASPEEVREEARQVFAEAREQLSAILNPQQQARLQELIGQRPGGEPAARPKREDRPQRPVEENPPEPTKPAEPPPTPPPVRAGQAAPDFELQRLDGKQVQLGSYKGKVLVLIFGSASSPSFRDRAESLDQLARQFASKASFLVIYTKEAHPAGEWEVERNKTDKISITRHQTAEERLERAKAFRSSSRLSIPFVVDSMDNKAMTDFAALQNSAFVIGKTGLIVARQSWCDPSGLERHIEEASRAAATNP